MKNLKILCLIVVLSLTSLSLHAKGGRANPKCVVKFTVAEDVSIIKVDSGRYDIDYLVQTYAPSLASDEMVVARWDIRGKIDPDYRTVIDTKDTTFFNAVLMTRKEWQKREDSLTWVRIQPYAEHCLKSQDSENLEDGEGGQWGQWLMCCIALILSICSLLLSILWHRKGREQLPEDVIEIVKNSTRLKDWRDEGRAAAIPAVVLNDSKDSDIRDLQQRVAKLEDALRAKSTETTAVSGTQPSKKGSLDTPTSPQMLYADNIVDDRFNKVKEAPSEDSVFELILKGASKASVTLYEKANKKILANPSYLEGCESQVMAAKDLSVVRVEREGEAEMDDNGKWRVKTRIKVVLK